MLGGENIILYQKMLDGSQVTIKFSPTINREFIRKRENEETRSGEEEIFQTPMYEIS